jgi:nucleoside-diphosphate-sugar epimerase
MSDLALITGGTGFLGQNLAGSLLARGRRVRLVLRPQIDRPDLPLLRAAGVELIVGELHDAHTLEAALQGVGEVYHLAGRLFVAGVPDDAYRQLHVEATRALLLACAGRAELRAIVHCSTTGVLGPTGPQPRDETAPLRPSNSYEQSKAEGERLARGLAQAYELPLVVARPALVYGPGDMHLLGWFRAIQRGWYRVIGAGNSLLHPIFVDDLSEGLRRCAETRTALGRVYHLVGERPLPIRELAAAIAHALGRRLPAPQLPLPAALLAAMLLEALPGIPPSKLPLTRSRVLFMSQSRAYCGCRARTELGFQPQIALGAGLRRTVAWYHERGLL